MFRTQLVEKIKTHILSSVNFLFENRAFYEIMCKNIVDGRRPQMTIQGVPGGMCQTSGECSLC